MSRHQSAPDLLTPDSETSIPGRASGFPRPRLLIVEDDAAIRELYALVLNIEGYDVETSCNGATGLERLAAEEFDLVMTDRAMPILDGVSMVLALRSAGCLIPVVMISGSFAQPPLPPQVAREIAAMVPKPARTVEIRRAVAFALHNSRWRMNTPIQPGLKPTGAARAIGDPISDAIEPFVASGNVGVQARI